MASHARGRCPTERRPTARRGSVAVTELERALDAFRLAMLHKFELRAERHPDTVTVDGGLGRLTVEDVERHYFVEIQERWEDPDLSPEEKRSEDIDVANMAFLSWYVNVGTCENCHAKHVEPCREV